MASVMSLNVCHMLKHKSIEAIRRLMSVLELSADEFEPNTQAHFDRIEAVFGKSLPPEIKRFLANEAQVSQDDCEFAFLGYRSIPIEHVKPLGSDDPDDAAKEEFIRLFRIPPEMMSEDDVDAYDIISTLNGEASEPFAVENEKNVIPLFDGGANYFIVLHFHGDGEKQLAVATQDYCLHAFAPSLTCHLKDLIGGIESGNYTLTEEFGVVGVEYPESWHERWTCINET